MIWTAEDEARRELKERGSLWLTEDRLNKIVRDVKQEAIEAYERNHKLEWKLTKNELPDPSRRVWFYPPLLAYRTGRWNPAGSRSDREDHWSPEYGADNIGSKDDVIAWAYVHPDDLPQPNVKIELLEEEE